MSTIHMFLQEKGGVGKSFAATLMAQKMIEEGKEPLCIDIDPVNPTFFAYKGINVKRVKIMSGDEIDPFLFDEMINMIAEVQSDTDVIIDNGSSSYVALASYITSNEIAAVLSDMGHKLVIHTVIIGGNALAEIVKNFAKLVASFADETQFVVWLNPFFGPVEQNGLEFIEFKAYKSNADRIPVVIAIPEFERKTFGRNLREMLEANKTFQEALEPKAALPVMTRQRLTMIRRDLWASMGNLEAI